MTTRTQELAELVAAELLKKLDKSGGTMTGNIDFSNGAGISTSDDDFWKSLDIYMNGSLNGGAVLRLRSRDSHTGPGTFVLEALTEEVQTRLVGFPAGSLTWGGREIERVEASGGNYIRYTGGVQMCWDACSSETWNAYPLPFIDVPSVTFAHHNDGAAHTHCAVMTTQNNLPVGFWCRAQYTYAGSYVQDTSVFGRYIAIGRWK